MCKFSSQTFLFNGLLSIRCCLANDEEHLEQKIHNWLSAPNCFINFTAATNKKAAGTGQWILNHPDYVKWKNGPSMLWIQGKGMAFTSLTMIYVFNVIF
ncbi:hypothetical protein BT96DRAFT_157083 [Gymnopus androsaceus JB14]|uniref:Nephrocystin 3-like N-terminal domain-containing protein n=1 Tax=Gymnopus androsaceus JB14 TaxID=1447944 RepID=A0A6A4HBZ7_9AGAR|nr:hypothetical protein BT96DRAFT_157083 [Gymnopus androsaceus JB14]